MAISKDSAVENARNDLAKRLKINSGDVKEKAVEDADFPDMALGAPEDDEMSGQMMTRGWRIKLEAPSKRYHHEPQQHLHPHRAGARPRSRRRFRRSTQQMAENLETCPVRA